jgi:hypothetical protein
VQPPIRTAAAFAPARAAAPGAAHPLAVVACLGGAAGLAAIAIRLAHDFDHGIWLVAYLLLVGCLAPALLAIGERRLLADPLAGDGARSAAALWLAGVVMVPAGVLADARILVCLGAVCLVLALLALLERAFAGGAAPARGRRRAELTAHAVVILAMAVSTGIGVLLAWGRPWL